jgi:cysteinylglycine-S-conjugate dipeptidase
MTAPRAPLSPPLAAADARFPALMEDLRQLVRIPSCSFDGFDPAHVDASAEATRALFTACGWPESRIVRLPGVLPYVIAADRRAGPDAPTLVLYAHHDVQPPLRENVWTTPPFEPVERDGRLYGRGAADDKAGVVMHAHAAAVWSASNGHPPCNLVAVIEGEEEIGSSNFAAFLRVHRDELAGDALVIADLANYDTGLPSLTTSLRGNLVAEIELRALKGPLHSGMWGGAVGDVCAALARLLSSLTDADGRVVEALRIGIEAPSAAEIASWSRLPFDARRFAEQAGVVRGGVESDPVALHRRLWREPSLAINALQAGVRGQTGNVLMDRAWARISLRIAPGQDPHTVQKALKTLLSAQTPAWCECTITERGEPGAAWSTPTDHPAFAAARAALNDGFGVDPVLIGCGASIPFVGEASAALGGIPAILLGVEDPACAAHAENESVHIDDLRKAFRSEVALIGRFATALR